jgi:3-methyladenine DNA glycosylase AlkD
MPPLLKNLEADLLEISSQKKALSSAWFFKTGKDGYAKDDKFIGVTVPEQRNVAKKYINLQLSDIQKLLHSEIHEFRLTALIILVGQFEKAFKMLEKGLDSQNKLKETYALSQSGHEGDYAVVAARSQNVVVASAPQMLIHQIYEFFLENKTCVNNWDLVDSSAWQIVGRYLFLHPEQKSILLQLAKSEILWDRRIAILATFYFIKQGHFGEIHLLASIFISDREDLIQKALGWMLREMGKKDLPTLIKFLDKEYSKMGRTCLRYSIEKLPEQQRMEYLRK